MNSRFQHVSLILALLFLLTACVQAQNSSVNKPAHFSFSCASWESVKGDALYYYSGRAKKNELKEDAIKRLKKVGLSVMTRSHLYEFKGGNKISFYRKGTNQDGEETHTVAASTTVPSHWKRVLLVFFPGAKPGEYRILPIQDDRDVAPYGSYQFINLTKLQLSGVLDKTKLLVKPNGKLLVKLRGDKSKSMLFGVWAEVEGKKKWLQRNTLTYKPSKYLIYFFYASKDARGQLKVSSKGIVEFRPPPVKTERKPVPEPED